MAEKWGELEEVIANTLHEMHGPGSPVQDENLIPHDPWSDKDWRKCPGWEPHHDSAEAIALAIRQSEKIHQLLKNEIS